MRPFQKTTFLLALLVALPAASASVSETDVEVGGVELGGCKTRQTEWLDVGGVHIPGKGRYNAGGYATNGCGGNGCDDRVEGVYDRTKTSQLGWELHEVRTSNGCSVSCSIQTLYSGTIRVVEGPGSLVLIHKWNDGYSPRTTVEFKCGPTSGSVGFDGWLEYPCNNCPVIATLEDGVPATEYDVQAHFAAAFTGRAP